MLAGAAKLRRIELRARTLARHHRAGAVHHLQLRRAVRVHVRQAPRVLAVAGASRRPDADPHVVPVHQAHVVEVFGFRAGAGDGELHEADRRHPSAGALDSAAAVAGGAVAIAGVIEDAPGSRPEAARPARRRWELDGAAPRQGEAAAAEGAGAVSG